MITVQVQNIVKLQNSILVFGLLVPSGNYVSGGDIVDFTSPSAAPVLLGPGGPSIPSSGPALKFDTWMESGDITYFLSQIIGTAMNNNKLRVFTATATELAAGAYPAALLADQIGFLAVFKALQ